MNFILTVLACLIFGWVDYWLYPPAYNHNWVGWYRAIQTTLQIAIVFCLWYFFSWIPAVSFLILWWVFGCDLIFYGCCELNILKDWPGKGSWNHDAGAGYYWAWWTPLGMCRFVRELGFKRLVKKLFAWLIKKWKSDDSVLFTQDDLYSQAIIGFAVVLILQAISR